MELKTIDENPKITDEVVFDLPTPDSDGCFLSDPYTVDSVVIYYVNRSFTSDNFGNTPVTVNDPVLQEKLAIAKADLCLSPTDTDKQLLVQSIQAQMAAKSSTGNVYYNEAKPVATFGNAQNPAWFSEENHDAEIIYGEAVTTTGFGTYPLGGGPPNYRISNVHVWDTSRLIEYVENTDYSVDYDIGEITTINTGAILAVGTILVDYNVVPGSSVLKQVKDEDGNPVTGHFNLFWKPLGMREGDYFICWTWTPLIAGSSLSAHTYFSLEGDTLLTTSIPTHSTNPEKYETLLDRYTPWMFKEKICSTDLTPEILQEFNKAVAKGFTFTENLANQMVDLMDANSTHESFLPYLANLFGLKLKSTDPTLWRRQIKRANALYKKKGTYNGLSEALSQAGINLRKFTKLWQLISPSTWQEAFIATAEQEEFVLSKLAILSDTTNRFVYFRSSDITDETIVATVNVPVSLIESNISNVIVTSDDGTVIYKEYGDYTIDYSLGTITASGSGAISDGQTLKISYSPNWEEKTPFSTYVTLANSDGITTATWVGPALNEGDGVRILYPIAAVASQPDEDYIQSLSLIDQRDERSQDYPPKNWNVRAIEEDDPMITTLIPSRNPYYDPLVYGMIRTEFPYSENIYNMEEYNGSTRDSTNPCDIDKKFVDPCSGGISSSFNLDVEITDISNDRLLETIEIIKEYAPFHARLHSMNIIGKIEDIVPSPIEEIQTLILYKGEEVAVIDPPQRIFNRVIRSNTAVFTRSDLTDGGTLSLTAAGTLSNDEIILYSPDIDFRNIGYGSVGSVEILSGPNSGTYDLGTAYGSSVAITGSFSEPVNQASFPFRLSVNIADFTQGTVSNSHVYRLTDGDEVDYLSLNVKTQWDKDKGNYGGNVWQVAIPDSSGDKYDILQILTDGRLLLENGSPSLSAGSTSYDLVDGVDVKYSGTGTVAVENRGAISFGISSTVTYNGQPAINTSDLISISQVAKRGAYLTIGVSPTEYEIIENPGNEIFISNYNSGTATPVAIHIINRPLADSVGYLRYKGLTLDVTNLESTLQIQNGTNPPVTPYENDRFMENFLVVINNASTPDSDGDTITPTTNYYSITAIDDNLATLSGPIGDWKLAGTSVTARIWRYVKQPVFVPEQMKGSSQYKLYDPYVDFNNIELVTTKEEDENSKANGVFRVSGSSIIVIGQKNVSKIVIRDNADRSIRYASGTDYDFDPVSGIVTPTTIPNGLVFIEYEYGVLHSHVVINGVTCFIHEVSNDGTIIVSSEFGDSLVQGTNNSGYFNVIWNSPGFDPISLGDSRISNVIVKDANDNTVYKIDRDYAVDELKGIVTPLVTGSIANGDKIYISYTYAVPYQFIDGSGKRNDVSLNGEVIYTAGKSILAHQFDFIDRRGNEVVDITTTGATMSMAMKVKALNNPNHFHESMTQKELVTFKVEYKE